MPIKTSSAKRKGALLQQHVRDKILATFPTLSRDDVVSCPMGSHGADVQLSAAAKAQFPYSIECKSRKGIALVYDALTQAQRGDGLTPLAVVKADRQRPLAVIDLDVFMRLISGEDAA